MMWLSIDQAKPTANQILAYVSAGQIYICARDCDDNFYICEPCYECEGWHTGRRCNFKYWMPLPEFPKECNR